MPNVQGGFNHRQGEKTEKRSSSQESKGQRADISQADRNALKAELSTIAANYRASVQAKVKRMPT
jgi:hypothetical protein